MFTSAGKKKNKAKARDYALKITGERGGDVLFTLTGRVFLDNARLLHKEVDAAWSRQKPAALTVDLGGVDYLDSAGALIVVELMNRAREQGVTCHLAQVPVSVQRILDLIDPASLSKPPLRPESSPVGLLNQMGQGLIGLSQDIYELIIFWGEMLFALSRAFRQPRRVRWGEVILTVRRAGMEGLPILTLMSMLLGMVIAFMSALQLQQFGATVYVASLVGIAMARELGPLLTAILVAGRSGSAFSAEIGTMQVNEEVDALTVMGFEPLHFLAVPKVLAAALVVPILAVYATLFGIIGGLFVGVTLLDLTVYTFITESYRVITPFDILSSLVKSMFFGIVIASIGCQRGFKVRGGAQEVGIQTTSAVVASLFLVIVIDGAFAIVLHYIQ